MRMKLTPNVIFISFLLAFSVSATSKNKPDAKPAPQAAAAASPVLATMQQELQREMAILGKADPPTYYLGYIVTDVKRTEVTGSNGALLTSHDSHDRFLEAQARVGSYDLDNTHSVGNGPGFEGGDGETVPID